ncbi:hypothetical protein EHS13_18645 [Paenibacillus psychroresistens]|uniref:Uncharacterized protein n=1 Tax=Paenibacillus psychroresistens TaxID=1778678 RepID=A0A6B8RMH6_9BACL|nr:hypothetical protein [Paenibacillus psychroresistens]QGQ96753.1 hypothetical protein EHS13_18645 [Paenibacillus psychroresistens]
MLLGQILLTDSDFEDAILNDIEVKVTQDGMHLGSGRVVSYGLHTVKLTSSYFFKDGCEFTVISMFH